MIYIGKEIPELNIDRSVYKPFIRNAWFRRNYMFFAYGLMIFLFFIAFIMGRLRIGSIVIRLAIFGVVYVVHELLHIVTICSKGDIYLNHSGIYLWLTPDIALPKGEFWLFMTMPLLILTVFTGVLSFITSDDIAMYLKYIAWINAVIAGSDIINSVLIALEPRDSIFNRGYIKKHHL